MGAGSKVPSVRFNVTADAYARYMGQYSVPLAARFVELADLHPGQRAIDVGCGPGALTKPLVDRLGAASVAAIDPSASFAEAMKARFTDVDVRSETAEGLPFPDDSFDAALAQLVVNFMTDPVAGLPEIARVTPSGWHRRGLRLGPRRRQRTARRVLARRTRHRSRRAR